MPITLSVNRLKVKDGNIYKGISAVGEDAQLNYTTPEIYGAIGDGIVDDTQAWQDAIDSGLPVLALGKTYKCGKLTVTKDADIDCGMASFICTDSILFDCYGTAETGTEEADYTAFGDYTLSDTFTGIAYILGTNNIFKQRSGYVGGSVEHFYNGKMDTVIPIDITGVTVYRLNTIQVNIRNISNVTFETTLGALIIKQVYCAYSVISNVNMTNVCYSVVYLNKCFKCTYRDSHFDIPRYGSYATNYYPVLVGNSCYTLVENIYGRAEGWHCIDTGGSTLCRKTRVANCELYTDYPIPSYFDHENGIETVLENCIMSSAGVSCLGRIINCDIHCDKDYSNCCVLVEGSSVEGLAKYIIENCRFYPQSSNAEIMLHCSPYEAGVSYDYYMDNVKIINCESLNPDYPLVVSDKFASAITGQKTIKDIYVINSELTVTAVPQNTYVFPEI